MARATCAYHPIGSHVHRVRLSVELSSYAENGSRVCFTNRDFVMYTGYAIKLTYHDHIDAVECKIERYTADDTLTFRRTRNTRNEAIRAAVEAVRENVRAEHRWSFHERNGPELKSGWTGSRLAAIKLAKQWANEIGVCVELYQTDTYAPLLAMVADPESV